MATMTLRAHRRPVFRHLGMTFGKDFTDYEVTDAQAAELQRCVVRGLIRSAVANTHASSSKRRKRRT